MDFLKSVLQGNNGGILGALLPLLTGKSGGGDTLSSILSLFNQGSTQGADKGQDFPPLFGNAERNETSFGSIMPLLQSMMRKNDSVENPAGTVSESTPAYPYELQYNHPDR